MGHGRTSNGGLREAGDQLCKALADSGKFIVLDIAPVHAAAHASNLQSCGGCDVKYAQQLGADLAITGVVQKVSNLILNMNIYLRDTHTGRLVTVMSADFAVTPTNPGPAQRATCCETGCSRPTMVHRNEMQIEPYAFSRAACQRR